ncbi:MULTISPECIES: AMP-dependent synthetase/ligase [unclassified Luteococcus]|uniref:AMP-dependent synthetase/ligase n=1 Tax=unclassified Luteococcus TaxID=2639923 RepID=UPI00313DA6FA
MSIDQSGPSPKVIAPRPDLPPVPRTSPAQVIDESNFHLARMIADSAVRFATRPATRVEGPDGQWQVDSYPDFHTKILALARALVARGVQPGERVVIFSSNRPEWSVCDLGGLSAGAIMVPIFATSTAAQVRHILTDSGAGWVFVAGQREAELVFEALGVAASDDPSMGLGSMSTDSEGVTVFSFDPVPRLTSLAELLAEDNASQTDEVERRIAAGRPEDVATIVYTSGTTGIAKGVMLTHGGFGNQLAAIDDCWDFQPEDHSVCFLPLAHSLERLWTFHLFHCGCQNTYCPNPKKIGELLPKAQPTLLVSVPMLFEKVMAGAKEKASGSAARQTMEWALRVGGQCQRAYRKGKQPAAYWRAQLPLADKLVLSKIRQAVGGNKTLMVSGGAPLRREVEEFFSAAGILLGQGYGLTESGPMMTIYRNNHYKLGTVGFVIKGSDLSIADGGEILVRGGSVMKGYWNNPEATAAAIRDGWLHTGDVGYVDPEGFVTITDRLKDIIVTANGKNVAPQAVEAALMADPIFEQTIVVGDARPCLVAVVQPSRDGWKSLADELGLDDDPQQLTRDPTVIEALRSRVAKLTEELAHHEQVRGVVLANDRITLASGLVTSTMKLKRREIEKVFAKEIEQLYAELKRSRRR